MLFIQHTEIQKNTVVVNVEGPLDSETSPDFEDYISQLLNNGYRFIILDAENLQWLSSEGIGVTVLIQKRIAELNGAFVVFNLSQEIISLYRILGFDKIIHIADNKSQALDIIQKQIDMRADEPAGNVSPVDEFSLDLPDREDLAGNPDFASFDERVDENPGQDKHPENDSTAGDDDIFIPASGVEVVFDPFVIECAKCASLIRIRKTGEYMCPSCKTEFTVMEDQTVIF